jgi:2-dehydropantoate 2-reductase
MTKFRGIYMQSHLVFGAGLIGGFMAGVLRSKNLSISLVVREKMKSRFENGLTLTDYNDHKVTVDNFQFVGDSDAIPGFDFLWLTVKCTSVIDSLADIRPYVSDQTVILCCQNGLGSDALVREAFPDNLVLRVMVPFNVADIAVNHLHRGSEGDVYIEAHAQVEALAKKIDCQLMSVHTSSDMDAVLWAKLQLNLVNAVNALADIPVKSMLEQRGYRKVIALLMQELLAVVRSEEINLPKLTILPPTWLPFILSLPDAIFKVAAAKMLAIDPTVRTSMWWDLSGGRVTEIEHLHGVVERHAKPFNIPTPVTSKIIQMIHGVENGSLQQGYSASDLLDEVL